MLHVQALLVTDFFINVDSEHPLGFRHYLEATAIADELCIRMATSPMVTDGRQIVMTSSFGVASITDQDTCLTDVVIKADRALYRSKRAGRNRVDLESSQIMRTFDGSFETV